MRIVVTKKGKAVQPKTLGQKKYIELINQNDIKGNATNAASRCHPTFFWNPCIL